jgi:L-iditol 2-dehydrogenase
MKAAVYHGPHDLRVEEVPVRELKDNEVLIQVKYCGVCGTDMHIFNGDGGSFEVNPPLIPGHEFSGVVAKVGSAVTTVKEGDRVSGDPNDMCGECYFCKNAMQHFCTNNIGVGTTVDGGFAEYVIMREKQVYKFAGNLSFKEAAMAEPISCCLHGIDLCNIKSGCTVLVMGGGPIGMIMMQLAKNAGAARVIMSEPVEEKRELALKLGATKTINPIEEDVQAVLSEYCENVDVVIECVGNIHTQEDAVKFAGKGAMVMYFGLASPEESYPLKPDDVFKKELTITSSFINPYTFERAIRVLESGTIELESLITNVVPLDDIVDVFTKPEYRRAGKAMIKIAD